MSKINVIKFVPYFPPHKGGLESYVQERSQWRVKKGYGEVMNVTPSMGQEEIIENGKLKIENGTEPIYYKRHLIGYKQHGYSVLVYPAFDLIPTFPFPKFWKREFWIVMKLARKFKADIVNTHTRFFLTSLMGGIFAKLTRTPWIHIEHGVDFVKLASKWKSAVAYLYDQTIGRCIFLYSDMVVGISAGCQRFANRFTKKKIPVIHRGMNFEPIENGKLKIDTSSKEGNGKFVKIGFVGRVVKLKGLDLLVEAFNNLQKKYTERCNENSKLSENFHDIECIPTTLDASSSNEVKKEKISKAVRCPNLMLEIVGDGDQLDELQTLVKDLGLDEKVSFLGFKDKEYVANEFLPHVDIVVNPSYQEGLPTSVLEGLLSKCVVVATRVGGTPEISDQKDLILVNKGSVSDLQKGLEYAIQNHEKLKGLSYDYVKEHFDWKRSIERYYEVYLGIIGYEK